MLEVAGVLLSFEANNTIAATTLLPSLSASLSRLSSKNFSSEETRSVTHGSPLIGYV
jgi:hypothetical protein